MVRVILQKGRITTAHGRFSSIHQVAQCAPHLTHASMSTPMSKSKTASRSVQPCLNSSRQRVAVLYIGPLRFLLKIASSHGGSGPQNCPFPWGNRTRSNACFLGPTQVLYPSRISIGSSVFAGLTIVTERPCYSVCNSRPHLHT